jgi:hypothetical protein
MDGFNRPIPAVLELDLSRHLSEVGFAHSCRKLTRYRINKASSSAGSHEIK